MTQNDFPKAKEADIALLLEGTFPYVRGGVSQWIHQILLAFSQYKFAIIFIGSSRDAYERMYYELPPNVVHFEEHYLHDEQNTPEPKAHMGDTKTFDSIKAFHENMHKSSKNEPMHDFVDISRMLTHGAHLNEESFLYSKMSFDMICESYQSHCTDPSFVDYFWMVRSMHKPIWLMSKITKSMIKVRLCHTISTGYAGFLGAMIRSTHGYPLMLTEHGIYTKERKIDLSQTEWIKDNRNLFQKEPTETSYFRQLWIEFFEKIGKFCYDSSDVITTLYEANRLRQIEDGAQPEKTMIIPNGVDVEKFAKLRGKRNEQNKNIICLIGRVVAIKDIKTFIRAMRIIVNTIPDAEGWIAGPTEEDKEYANECINLCESLGLRENVKFLGFQNIEELFPKISILALTSISEALPLVILEAAAAGVPSVVTDVGSCKQLIEGLGDEDTAIGDSGAVVPISDPGSFAKECIKMLKDDDLWTARRESAIARVESFYTKERMIKMYGEIYERIMH